MAKRKDFKKPPRAWKKRAIKVYRITIDEKLDDTTVRFLVCPLVKNIKKFSDRKTKQIVITDRRRNWEEELDFIVSRDDVRDFLLELGLKFGTKTILDWEDIKEGRTCLLGEVTCRKVKRPAGRGITKREEIKQYIVDKKKKRKKTDLFWIDKEVKEIIKRLYFSTLRGRRKHAVTN